MLRVHRDRSRCGAVLDAKFRVDLLEVLVDGARLKPRICAMSRLVLPLDSHDSTSPSRVVRPSSLENSAGVSALESLQAAAGNSFVPSFPILQPKLLVAGKRGHDRGFRSALPLRACSSHCGIDQRQHDIVVAIGGQRIRQQFLRLRRRPHDLAALFTASR